MKKQVYFFAAAVLLAFLCLLVFVLSSTCPVPSGYFKNNKPVARDKGLCALTAKETVSSLAQAFEFLRTRRDKEALSAFEAVLSTEPDNLSAMWGKAEMKRRQREYAEAEGLLKKIISRDPSHAPSLNSLAYIRYNSGKLDDALGMVNKVLSSDKATAQDKALAYMMIAAINSKRSSQGWFFSKIRYGTQIKCYFLKAMELSPDLPEVHLGLGSFYLMAPGIAGGNPDKAVEELECAVKIAPGFATANARLAQAYKKKGDMEKYQFYKDKTFELDPHNEVLPELK